MRYNYIEKGFYSMKNMRIPLLIVLGVAIIGIIFGSIFDLNISSAIASPSSGLGLTISAFGPTIGFAGVAAMGGGFIAFSIKGKYHIALKILFGVLALCCFGVSIKYPAGEYFGINGFYNPKLEWLGYIIVLPIEAAAGVGGYFLFKNCENKNMWIVFVAIIAMLCIALLAVIPALKAIMHRPRYRIVSTTDVEFHRWWEPCSNYKDLMKQYGIESSDHFKSYPSGHTAEASIALVVTTLFPLADRKLKKYQMPFFYGACGLVLLVALARILAAAHYLSDVSTGATIIIVLLLITNEVVLRIKPLQLPEEQPEVKE